MTETKTLHRPTIEKVGKNYMGRMARVTIDGISVELKVPKGTRGLKEGQELPVEVEMRDWYDITSVRFDMLRGTQRETTERRLYSDGISRPHYRVLWDQR